MELQDWRKEPRKNYSNEFKLRMVELAWRIETCLRLWQPTVFNTPNKV